MVVLKVASIFAGIGFFFGFFVFGPGYDAVAAQCVLLFTLFAANTWRNGWASTRSVCATLIPFVLSLVAFGLLFTGYTCWGARIGLPIHYARR